MKCFNIIVTLTLILLFSPNLFISLFTLIHSVYSTSLPLCCSLHCATLLYSTLLTARLCSFLSHRSLQLCKSQKKSDFDCYFEPMSKCTIFDALAGADGKQLSIDDITHVGDITRGEEDKYMQKYTGKKYDLFCCHHEIMITFY